GFPYLAEAWAAPGDRSRIVAAVLGVIGTALTALGAFGLWSLQHRADQQREKRRRRDRRLRVLIALRAELGLNLQAQFGQFGPAQAAQRKAQFVIELQNASASEHSMPMAVVSQTNDVFDNIKDEIADLPDDTIAPIIAYYQQDEYVSQLLARFSDGQFEKVSKIRRERAISALFVVGRSALDAAIDAFDAVHRTLEREKIPVTPTVQAIISDITKIKSAISARDPVAADQSDNNDGRSK
ncbi:MAG: hypothetical protein AAF408_09455, partial [Pseudomonadota bacterium]